MNHHGKLSLLTRLIALVCAFAGVTGFAQAPAFTTNLPANKELFGGIAEFNFLEVFASGAKPMTYRWRKDGQEVLTVANSDGSSRLYGNRAITLADAGSYTVEVSNSAGTVTSTTCVATVGRPLLPPRASISPATVTATAGNAITLSAEASNPSGLSMVYQWYDKNLAPIAGATALTLNLPSVKVADAGWYYLKVDYAPQVAPSYPYTASVALAVVEPPPSVPPSSGAVSIPTPEPVSPPASSVAPTNPGAIFPHPAGLAVVPGGVLLVSDAVRNTISKVDASGNVSLFAGAEGEAGSADGQGSQARFNRPGELVLDAAGTLYLADRGNATVRQITPAGAVTTVAGSPANRGNRDGAGGSAWFSSPEGLARDAGAGLLVADADNHTIRRITAAGVVTTLAGRAGLAGDTDGAATVARFNQPSGVVANAAGTIYVADTYNNVVRRISPAGEVSVFVGTPGVAGSTDGTGLNALFNRPTALALDAAGNLYVADTANSTIRKVTPAGVVVTYAGLAAVAGLKDGRGGGAQFNQPRGIAVDSAGMVYVADSGNAALRTIATDGTVRTMQLARATVEPTPVAPLAPVTGSPSTPTTSPASAGGGGGGAPSLPGLAALVCLGLARAWQQHRRTVAGR